jgi:hypothetical protein
MNTINSVHAVRGAAGSLSGATIQSPENRPPLPTPGVAGPADYQDALLLLMHADIQQGAATKALGQAQIAAHKQAIDTNRKKEAQAVAEQQKAENESHGFWAKLKKFAGTVAKIAAVAAAAVSAVFSGGATLVAIAAIAAVALSGGAMVVRETRMFGDLSDKVGLGMDIASAVVGMAACGAGVLGAVKAADETAKAVKIVTAGAQLTGALATGTSAVAGGFVAGYQHDADLSAVDAESARAQMATHSRDRQMVMDWLASVSDLEADATNTTMRTLEACNQATNIAIAGIRA